MKKFISLLILVMVTVFSLATVFANGNDDQGQPNDPNENDRANACYSGGTMESKCDTAWEWFCGWVMIRYDAGIFTREQVPSSCVVLLPGEIEVVEDPAAVPGWPPAGCYYSPAYSNPPDLLYIIWEGNQTQPSGFNLTGNCSSGPSTGVGGFFYVSAPDATSAEAICDGYSYNFIDEISSSSDTGAWPIYRCQIP